jgi:hypothetical protein
MQLELFRWDLIAVGNGYRSLAGLDFQTAKAHFSRAAASRQDHLAAVQEGLHAVQFWEEAFRGLEGLAPRRLLSGTGAAFRLFHLADQNTDKPCGRRFLDVYALCFLTGPISTIRRICAEVICTCCLRIMPPRNVICGRWLWRQFIAILSDFFP